MEPPDPDAVDSIPDFIDYLERLARHFERERNGEDWQHWEIDHFLESMAAWLRSAPHFREAAQERERELLGGERPTWRGVAILFDAARVYE